MSDTLGLYEEARQLALDLGYVVREEVLGDLPGGLCAVQGTQQLLLNLEHGVAERLGKLLAALAADPRIKSEPKSRLLEARLRALGSSP